MAAFAFAARWPAPSGLLAGLLWQGMLAPLVAWGVVLAVLVGQALAATGGHFAYALDDPYIHLAVARSILDGSYGVNPGEWSSPSSSILWPLLLLPFFATPWPELGPLLLGFAASAAALGLFARILADCGVLSLRAAGWVAIPLLIVTFMGALPLYGMEHGAHAAATLYLLWATLAFLRGQDTFVHVLIATVLTSGLRYEGLAAVASAGGLLVLAGRWRSGIGVLAAGLALPAGFAALLVSHGLPPLPSSILVKAAYAASRPSQLQAPHLLLIVSLSFIAATLAFAWWQSRQRGRGAPRSLSDVTVIAAFAAGVAVAHLLFGVFGWRYEAYALFTTALALVAVAMACREHHTLVFGAIAATPLYVYSLTGTVYLPESVDNIYSQQVQMARLVREHLREPVAVNDIGAVAWAGGQPIVDLGGLASEQARRLARQGDPAWLAQMMPRGRGPRVALIYDSWFPQRPEWWRKVGTLVLEGRRVTPASSEVSVYATDPAAEPAVREALLAFARKLPPHACVSFADAGLRSADCPLRWARAS